MAIASSPESLITAIADKPCAVANATIVSFNKMLADMWAKIDVCSGDIKVYQ
jgi:hypothetical protein